MRRSRHNRSRPKFSFSRAGPNACSAITSRACGVTISRSTASVPIAASRLWRLIERDGRQQLPEQRDDDGDVDGDAGRARFVEQFGQAPAGREIGNELEPIGVRAIEPAQVHVRRVTNGGKARDTFAERRYKSGMLDKRRREIETFDLVACFGVDPVRSRAESINRDRYRSISHIGAL